MSYDLTNRNISDSFGNLLQKTGSDNQLYDLKGNPIVDLTIDGTLYAQSYVVSQSTTLVTSGSNIFGNSNDDTHYFQGNITASNVISASGTFYALAGKFANQGEFTGSGNIHPALGIHGKLQITTGSKSFTFKVDETEGNLTLLSGSTPVLKFGSLASTTGSFIEAQGNISASGDIFLDNTSHIYFKSASSAGSSVKNIDVVFVSNNNVPRFGDGSMVYETLVFGQGAVMTISGSCFGMGNQTSINAGDLSSLEPTKTLTVNGDISASGDLELIGGITSSLFKAGYNVDGTRDGIAVEGDISASGYVRIEKGNFFSSYDYNSSITDVTAQNWDMGHFGSNYIIGEITVGSSAYSRIPFKIRPKTPID